MLLQLPAVMMFMIHKVIIQVIGAAMLQTCHLHHCEKTEKQTQHLDHTRPSETLAETLSATPAPREGLRDAPGGLRCGVQFAGIWLAAQP